MSNKTKIALKRENMANALLSNNKKDLWIEIKKTNKNTRLDCIIDNFEIYINGKSNYVITVHDVVEGISQQSI